MIYNSVQREMVLKIKHLPNVKFYSYSGVASYVVVYLVTIPLNLPQPGVDLGQCTNSRMSFFFNYEKDFLPNHTRGRTCIILRGIKLSSLLLIPCTYYV